MKRMLKWVLFVLTASSIFYYIDLRPLSVEIQGAKHLQEQLKKTMLFKKTSSMAHKNKSSHSVYVFNDRSYEITQRLINDVERGGFLIEEIYSFKNEIKSSVKIFPFSLVASGESSRIENLIVQLFKSNNYIDVDEIIVSDIGSGLVRIKMKINVFSMGDVPYSKKIVSLFDWVGCMKKNNKYTGLLRLQNGKLQEVTEGSIIENSVMKVLRLDSEKMVIDKGDQRVTVIYGQSSANERIDHV